MVYQILLIIVKKLDEKSILCYVLCLIQHLMIQLLYRELNDQNFLAIFPVRILLFFKLYILIIFFPPDSLYSPEITEAARRSNLPSIGQRNTPPRIPQYPSMIASPAATNGHTPQHESRITTPLTPNNGRFQNNASE